MELLAFLWDLVVHLDVHLGEFVRQHGVWVYGLLFVIVFCETGLVVTPFLPGDSLLFVAGTLAALGEMSLLAVIATLIVAALCGDNSNYWVGRWAGMRLFGRWINPAYLQRTHEFYERHGGKAVVLSRFLPIVRTYVPFVAGMALMTPRQYTMYNVAGGVAWVGTLCYAGYFFGNIPWIRGNLTAIIVGIVIVSLLPLAYAFLKSRMQGRSA